MNTATNVMSSNLVNNDELRELSQTEQVETTGGRACYKRPPGEDNYYRWVLNANGKSATQQVFKNGAYRYYTQMNFNSSILATKDPFASFCYNGRFYYIY